MILHEFDKNVNTFEIDELHNRGQRTVELAHRYLEIGWKIVSAHAPIHSESGRVGCTCEAYKRSDAYRKFLEKAGRGGEFDPNFICPSPGKHPRGNWRNDEGIGLDGINHAWGRLHTAIDVDTGEKVKVIYNIGLLTGPSNVLAFDVDDYKDVYDCELSDFIPVTEQYTPEQISQSGGRHLLYNSEEKRYTNANGNLPAGIDIRGEGGFLMLAPSLGQSGNEYAWEEGSEPWNIDLLPIPHDLDEILAENAGKGPSATGVSFLSPTTDKPDLDPWSLSTRILELIDNPTAPGTRSESDMSVIVALCYVGASDDEILAVFEHYPIGTEGKFAESGRQYLAHSIGKARAFVADNPRSEERRQADIQALIAHEIHRAENADFSEIVPVERQSATGYRTGPTDKQLYLRILGIMQGYGRISGLEISLRQIANYTNSDGVPVSICTQETVRNFLDRVAGVLIDTEFVMRNNVRVTVLSLAGPVVATLDTLETPASMIMLSNLVTTGNVQEYLGDDAFLRGRSKPVREQIDNNKKSLVATFDHYAEAARAYQKAQQSKPTSAEELRNLMGADVLAVYCEMKAMAESEFLPALGTYGLIVLDDLAINPGATRKEVAERRGLNVSSVANVVRKLVKWELVEEDRESVTSAKQYTVADDVWAEVKRRTPEAMTYTAGVRRRDAELQRSQAHAVANLEICEGTEKEKAARIRLAKIENKRRLTLAAVDPTLSEDEITQVVCEGSAQKPRKLHPSQMAEQRAERMTADENLVERNEIREAIDQTIEEFSAWGIKPQEAYNKAILLDYSEREAAIIASGLKKAVAA